MEKFTTALAGLCLILPVIAGIAALLALPVMWLWNATMPELFGLQIIGFWMAVKLSLLCGFLFKSAGCSK